MPERSYNITPPGAMNTPAGEQFERDNAQLGELSTFRPIPAQLSYLGWGPDEGVLPLSYFDTYPGFDYGYRGDLPSEEQPTIPEFPPHLQGPRR